MLTFLFISFLEMIAIVFLEKYNQQHSLLIYKKATHISFSWPCLSMFFIKRRGELQHMVLVSLGLAGPTWSLQDKPHKDPQQSSQRVNYIANNLRPTKLSRQHSFTHQKKINLNSSLALTYITHARTHAHNTSFFCLVFLSPHL